MTEALTDIATQQAVSQQTQLAFRWCRHSLPPWRGAFQYVSDYWCSLRLHPTNTCLGRSMATQCAQNVLHTTATLVLSLMDVSLLCSQLFPGGNLPRLLEALDWITELRRNLQLRYGWAPRSNAIYVCKKLRVILAVYVLLFRSKSTGLFAKGPVGPLVHVEIASLWGIFWCALLAIIHVA